MTTIRSATRKDAPDIARVYVDSWRESYAGLIPDWVLLGMSYRRLARAWDRAIRTAGRDEAILVAESAEHGLVGLGSCGPSRDPALDFSGEVYTLYVHPNNVGQGVGTKLMHALFDKLAEKGKPSAHVWALAQNPSRHFYKALGGGIVGTRQGRQWGVAIHEVAYGWRDLKLVLNGKALNNR
jgi:L-amino acid N-acyltransferase YncA